MTRDNKGRRLAEKFSAPKKRSESGAISMYFVYILKSKSTGRHYVGYTNNLQRRLKEHNNGKTRSLVKYIPLEIILVEEYKILKEAREREKQIKSYKSGEAFKKLLNLQPTPSAGC